MKIVILVLILLVSAIIFISTLDIREGLTSAQIMSQLTQQEATTPPPDHDLNRYYYDPVKNKYVTRAPTQVLYSINTSAPNMEYDLDNIGITYHADVSSIMQTEAASTAGIGRMWVVQNGELVSVPYSDVSNTTLYYDPTERKYAGNYVPGYAEYVKLSRFSKSRVNPPFMSTFDGSNYPANTLDLRPNLPDLPNVPAYTWQSIMQIRIPENNIPYEHGLLT